jgi:cyclophilin family peptidyl-prolyl cis-trans isomerase
MMKSYIITGAILLIGGGFLVFSYVSNQSGESEGYNNNDTVQYNQEEAINEPANDQGQESENNNNVVMTSENMTAIMKTNKGEVKIEFFNQDAPKTVENFAKLAQDGFYNGIKFHRVIPGFMVQGGDPLTKDDSLKNTWGTGDPGYKFEDEIHANNKNNTGTLAMANSGPNTNGSQFFINVADNNFLDAKHTVFGKVVEGMDVVHVIVNVPTEGPDRPVDAVVIESITIETN